MKCLCNQNQTAGDICLKTFISSMLKLGKRVASMFNLKTYDMLPFFFLIITYDIEFNEIFKKI